MKEEEETEMPHVKEEEQEEEISKSPLTAVIVKSEKADADHDGRPQSDDRSDPLSEGDDIASHWRR